MNGPVKQQSRLRHNLFMATALMAFFGFAVAFIQADRGRVLYQEYVVAYEACFYGAMHSGAADPAAVAASCSVRSQVVAPLAAHRQAYAVGEPFLYLGVFLTLLLVVGPLLGKRRRLQPDAHLNSDFDTRFDQCFDDSKDFPDTDARSHSA